MGFSHISSLFFRTHHWYFDGKRGEFFFLYFAIFIEFHWCNLNFSQFCIHFLNYCLLDCCVRCSCRFSVNSWLGLGIFTFLKSQKIGRRFSLRISMPPSIYSRFRNYFSTGLGAVANRIYRRADIFGLYYMSFMKV